MKVLIVLQYDEMRERCLQIYPFLKLCRLEEKELRFEGGGG